MYRWMNAMKSRWLGQSGRDHLGISRTCVCVFNFVFSCFFFLVWNRSTVQTMERLSSVRRYECRNHVQHPHSNLTSRVLCKKGVKGVDKPIFWYFREKSQTNHKLMGTSCICVMYVSRGFYNVSVDERNKIVMVGSIWW